jgi:hypothetical protein
MINPIDILAIKQERQVLLDALRRIAENQNGWTSVEVMRRFAQEALEATGNA